MNINLNDNGFHQQKRLMINSISERISIHFSAEGMNIVFMLDESIGPVESYQIKKEDETWYIVGSDSLGLFYGIGKFLHTAKWSDVDFVPNPPSGIVSPDCSYRVIYFSVHAYNWFHMAPTEDLEKYLEELLLWGYNGIHLCVPIFNLHSFDEPLFYDAVEKTRSIYALAKNLGMKCSFGIVPNQGLLSAPHEFDAEPVSRPRPNNGRNLCPSKPGVIEYLKECWNKMFEPYKDIEMDFFMPWPYDEGGCTCETCSPWGAKAYLDLCILAYEEAKKLFPKAKFVVSTWLYDQPDDQGEYAGLYKRLKGDMAWVDYIMVDNHADFPKYPLEHEVIKPIINFPEISMWKLFPWGGYGANPLPEHFQEIWDSSKRVLNGGQPYSEGLYEDISKIQFIGYYWDKNRHWKDILAEYINYEYQGDVCEEVLEMMELIERNHVLAADNLVPDFEASDRAAELALSVDARLNERAKASWRWRILYIRAIIDKKRYDDFKENCSGTPEEVYDMRHFGATYLVNDKEAQDMIRELRKIYHCVEFNGSNGWTLPTLDGEAHFKRAEPMRKVNKID